MHYLQQILFVALSGVAIWLFAKKAGEIRRNIFLGKAEDLNSNRAVYLLGRRGLGRTPGVTSSTI